MDSRPWPTCCLRFALSVSGVLYPQDQAQLVVQRTFKRETLQGRRAFIDDREARLTSFRWLHRYNTVRRHSRLGQRSPITYENTQAAATMVAAAA